MPVASSIQISEIYTSVQGESTLAGFPTTFVRTTGCPVRCVYCDSAYAFTGGNRMTVAEVVTRVTALSIPRVCLTGGEPLAQASALELIEALIASDIEVSLETSGVRSIEAVPRPCKIVLDIKTPDSGVLDAWLNENINYLRPGDELKAVIMSKNDWDWFNTWYDRHQAHISDNITVSVSPSAPELPAEQLVEWLIAAEKPYRLNLQIHKYIWPNDDRGR